MTPSYSPLKGRSVPFWRNTRYCSGVSSLRHSSSVLLILSDIYILIALDSIVVDFVAGAVLPVRERWQREAEQAGSINVFILSKLYNCFRICQLSRSAVTPRTAVGSGSLLSTKIVCSGPVRSGGHSPANRIKAAVTTRDYLYGKS